MTIKNNSIKFIMDLLKNLDKSDVTNAAQMIMESIDNKDVIYVPIENNNIKVLDFSEIICVITNNKGTKIIIYTIDREYLYTNTHCNVLNFLEEYGKDFKFISSEAVINVNFIEKYDSYYFKVWMKNGKEINSNGTAIKNIVKKYAGSSLDLNIARTATNGEYSKRGFFNKA